MKALIPLMLGLLAASTASAYATQTLPQGVMVAGNDTIILSSASSTAATIRGKGGATTLGNDTIGVTP